jgi:hypothetical protein
MYQNEVALERGGDLVGKAGVFGHPQDRRDIERRGKLLILAPVIPTTPDRRERQDHAAEIVAVLVFKR